MPSELESGWSRSSKGSKWHLWRVCPEMGELGAACALVYALVPFDELRDKPGGVWCSMCKRRAAEGPINMYGNKAEARGVKACDS